eukprot:6021623-Pyramimonas_sp.AAC.1
MPPSPTSSNPFSDIHRTPRGRSNNPWASPPRSGRATRGIGVSSRGQWTRGGLSSHTRRGWADRGCRRRIGCADLL